MIARAAALALLILPLFGSVALADPVPLLTYERVLADARVQVEAARAAAGEARDLALRRASAALAATREVSVGTAVYTAAPHGAITALIEKGDDASLATASAMLEETLAAVRGAEAAGGADAAQARERLDAILGSPDFRQAPDWRDVFGESLRGLLARLFPGASAPTFTRTQITIVLGAVATLLLALVARAALGGLRGKVTREALLAPGATPRGTSAADHLQAADEARRAGRLRDALRELFLGALVGLEQHGELRFDPALTDRELLARAAGTPRAPDLEALVALYERAWYGLREPSQVDLERASELAQRIAA